MLWLLVGIDGLMLGKSMGSGTIIDPDGTILTCAHVVVDFEGARTVTKGKVSDSHFGAFIIILNKMAMWVVFYILECPITMDMNFQSVALSSKN